MPLIKAGTLAEIPAGEVKEIESNGASFALCNVDGVLFCVDGTCPHAGGPLGQGTLHGNKLVCPWHAWEFDCRTGLVDTDDDALLATYPVTLNDGDILIDIP